MSKESFRLWHLLFNTVSFLMLFSLDFTLHQIQAINSFKPSIDLLAIFFFTPKTSNYRSLGYPALYLVGLVRDAIYMAPMGLHPLSYILFYYLLHIFKEKMEDYWTNVLYFSIIMGIALSVQWGGNCLFFGRFLSPMMFIANFTTTAITYIILALATIKRNGKTNKAIPANLK